MSNSAEVEVGINEHGVYRTKSTQMLARYICQMADDLDSVTAERDALEEEVSDLGAEILELERQIEELKRG